MKKDLGDALLLAQTGLKSRAAKPFKGVGGGVFEIVENYDSDTYRAVYAVQIGKHLYVLHAFQKKSKKGRETPKQDVALIKQRLKLAKARETGQ